MSYYALPPPPFECISHFGERNELSMACWSLLNEQQPPPLKPPRKAARIAESHNKNKFPSLSFFYLFFAMNTD